MLLYNMHKLLPSPEHNAVWLRMPPVSPSS